MLELGTGEGENVNKEEDEAQSTRGKNDTEEGEKGVQKQKRPQRENKILKFSREEER